MPAARNPPTLAAPESGSISTIVAAGAIMLMLAGLGLGSIFYFAPYEQALALGTRTFNDEGYYRLTLALTPARYCWLRALMTAGALTGLLLGGWLHYTGNAMAPLRAEIRRALARTAHRWNRLPLSGRLVAGGLLAALVVIRSWYLLYYPLGTDEVASYDYFVHDGPLAITSYYPIPNNHILYNLLAYPLAKAGLSTRLAMRLPTLVVGTVGSGLSYLLLARLTGLRLATLITGLVNLAPIWVYYAAVGRGYFIEICFIQTGFFAVVELLRPASAYRRLSWGAFVASSILGFYTIPTYAYPFAGLGLGLGGGLLLQLRWPALRALAVANLVILVVTLLLYAPVVLVTGLKSLVANRYVAAKTMHQFWPSFRAVLYETAAELFGPSLRLSGPAWLAGALLAGVAVRHWVRAGSRQIMGLLAWAMLATPILLMAVQRVYAPTRTILYLTFFGYLLLGLLVLPPRILRQWIRGSLQWPLIVGTVVLIGSYRLARHQSQVKGSRYETQQLEQSYQWLIQQPSTAARPKRVWLDSPLHELFFAHYGIEQPQPQLHFFSGSKEGPRGSYDFVVAKNDCARTVNALRLHYHPVYHDYLVTIYAVRP